MSSVSFFVFYVIGDHRDLHALTHSFPTRRASDLIARLLRLGRDGKVEDAGAAAQAAEDALAGFRAEGALVSDDDLAAIVAGDDGHVAVVKCHGVNLAEIGRAHV